jgi:hypothetical protein
MDGNEDEEDLSSMTLLRLLLLGSVVVVVVEPCTFVTLTTRANTRKKR